MKVKKLLCLGMAAALMCSNLFQMRISAQELNAVDAVMENAIDEESAGVSNAENGDYEYVELEDGTLEISRYYGSDTYVVIPEEINGRKVTSIGGGAFAYKDSLTNITIPDSVTNIGSSAFQRCGGLISIMIPDSVTNIRSDAFDYCDSLMSITIPDGVTSIGSRAFRCCKKLTSITIPDGVTSIGTEAFSGCSGLTSITIPDGVTNIVKNAFWGCSGLTSITIPDGVTSIGSYAFGSCNGLTSITIPDSVTSIGDWAFYNCSGLMSITIPEGVTSIVDNAFWGCSGLKSIRVESENSKYDSRENCNAIIETESNELICGCKNTIIPANVTSIGSYAFRCCEKLTSITIPDGVTSIGACAFDGCVSLTSITIFDGLTSIGFSAFGDCSGLTSITIPDSVTSIGSNAFNGCSGLTSITIPDGVTSIGSNVFNGCNGLVSMKVNDENPKYDSRENCNAIIETESNELICGCKNTIIPASVTSIGSCALCDCSSLTSIAIPDGVTSIGSNAFNNCSGLTSITIPDSVRSIGYSAFNNCSGLKSITIPDGVRSIGYSAFNNCSGLKSITIPNGVRSIESETFKYCSSLTNIMISEGVTSIEHDAFSDCISLTSITIPGSVTSIGSNAFYNCRGLTSITIPAGVMGIGSSTFQGCSGLKSIKVESENSKYDSRENCNAIIETERNQLICGCKNTIIPASVRSIGPKAFTGCSGLTSIAIPDGVTSIGDWAFYDCSGLTSITIPDSVTSIRSYAFTGCSSLTSITIPDGVTSIGDSTFNDCSGLKSIKVESENSKYDSRENCNAIIETERNQLICGCKNTIIPASVRSIGSNAFTGCSGLTSITIPDGVTSIGSWAFNSCIGLTSITIPNSVTGIRLGAFSGCSSLTIFGKKGSYAKTYAEEHGIPFSAIEEPQNIANCEITLSVASYIYDGSEKEPIVTVKDGSTRLVNGKDYLITYSDNIDAGTATVTIRGIGNYTGTTSKTFTISAKSISGTNVTLGTTSYTYDGTEKRPSVTVKDGSATLISGTHYTVSYSNNVNVGTATVNITGKGNYAGTVSKTFTILAKRKSFLWNQDNWNFNNSSYQGYFSSGKYINQINDTYLNKLKSNLTNSEYRGIFDSRTGWINNRFGGSCYGMSSTSLLAMEGILPYSNYKSGATKLYQLSYPMADSNISSLITYYQMLQIKSVIQQQYRTVPYKTNKENIQSIISLLDENNTVLIGFQKTGWGGHAILAYGYEYGSYTWNGVSYQGCIKICDPNSSKEYKKECNIYYNTNTYNWTIPYYSSVPITSISGAKFNYVGADVNEINYGGYLSGTSNVNVSNYVARIDAAAVSENRSVTKVSEVDGNYLPQNNAPGDIIEDYSYVLGAESAGTIGYNLYDAESAYKLSQDNAEKLQLSMNYEDCYLEGGSSAGNAIIFDKNGYVSVSGESADYNISMTFDDDYQTDWFTIQIDGSGSNEVSLEKSDTGYILSGDNLENVEVSVNNKYDSAHARFTTEFPSAYIYEINGGMIGVKVDADENGTYETMIATEDTHQYDNNWKTDDNNHWKECKCGEKSELAIHEFEWIIDREETMTESGLKHEECTVCGYKQNENTIIHKHVKVVDKAIAPTCTDTGLTEGEHCSECGEILEKQQVVKALGHNYVQGVCSRCGALKTEIPQKGQELTDPKTGAVYMVTSVETKGGTVDYVKSLRNGTSNISIPSTVEINGISYKVTSIAANAFKNNKKLTKIKIGDNIVSIGNDAFFQCTSLKTVTIPAKVENIGKQAFYRCKKLKTIKIKTRKLINKNVGKKAFAKINPKAVAKVPASCLKSYKKLLQKKGVNGTKQKIRK